MKFEWTKKKSFKNRKRRPIKRKTLQVLKFWLYCEQKKKRHMETGKIRFVMFDPLSREAIYRGTLHIEYANQDPDIVEPINIEKISKRFEWEGTNSDWFGFLVVVLITLFTCVTLYVQSPWYDISWRRFHPSLTPSVWRIAFATWSFIGINQFTVLEWWGPVFELNLVLLEMFIAVISKILPNL